MKRGRKKEREREGEREREREQQKVTKVGCCSPSLYSLSDQHRQNLQLPRQKVMYHQYQSP